MDYVPEKKYENNLFADISAITLRTRVGKPILTLLKNKHVHKRLVNGSDYPLPAINIIITTRQLLKQGYLSSADKLALDAIYHNNRLLFDFVLKRTIKHPETGDTFGSVVFSSEKVFY